MVRLYDHNPPHFLSNSANIFWRSASKKKIFFSPWPWLCNLEINTILQTASHWSIPTNAGVALFLSPRGSRCRFRHGWIFFVSRQWQLLWQSLSINLGGRGFWGNTDDWCFWFGYWVSIWTEAFYKYLLSPLLKNCWQLLKNHPPTDRILSSL